MPPAQTALERNLQFASRALGVAQGVAGKDYTRAAVSAFSLGATVNSTRKGGAENRWNDAANMAQAGLDYHQAEKGRTAATQAVTDAQKRLDAAKRNGNPEVIRQAEADLKRARGAAESALMGGIAAGESLLATARDIGARNRAAAKQGPEEAKKPPTEEERKAQTSASEGKKTKERLADVVNDADAPVAVREAALAEHQKLRKADEDLQRALTAAGGDPEKVKTARESYDKVRQAAESRLPELKGAAESGSPTPASPASSEASGSPGLASMQRPQRIGTAQVTKGVTVWEISQRTGVPVERILEFNAQSGNPLDPRNLQIGQQILVPMDKEDVKFKALSAEQVRDLRQKAIAEKKAKESITVPPARSSDQPPLRPEDLRSKSLHLLANDRALIDEGVKSADFKLSDPTTWVDNKQEKARTQARDAFKQSVDRLESVLKDPQSTEAQIRAAIVDKQTALNLFSGARHAAHVSNEGTKYLTPVGEAYKAVVADPFHEQTQRVVDAIDKSSLPEVVKGAVKAPLEIIDKEVSFDFKGAIQTGQDALHAVAKPVIQAIENSGARAPLVAAATLPLRAAAGAVDYVAGIDKHVVSTLEGIGNMVVHPVDTAEGLAHLGVRSMEANPQGRALLFAKDLATGKFKTQDEAIKAMRDSLHPVLMAKAGYELSRDVATGMLAEPIKLVKEGKYADAAGSITGLLGEFATGAVATKLGAVGKTGQALNQGSRVERVVEGASQTVRVADKVDDAAMISNAALHTVELGAHRKSIAKRTATRTVWEADYQAERVARTANPLGGTENCVNCSIAVDAILAGRPASALLSAPKPLATLEAQFGKKFVAVASKSEIVKEMMKAGPGARGIIYGDPGLGQVGHVFNVINHKGVVRFIDGQAGEVATFSGYGRLKLLRTN